jgi:hypothetical protein
MYSCPVQLELQSAARFSLLQETLPPHTLDTQDSEAMESPYQIFTVPQAGAALPALNSSATAGNFGAIANFTLSEPIQL